MEERTTSGEAVPVIAHYPRRQFRIWEYRVSHDSLLIRSPKNASNSKNIDLVFVGVEFLSLPSFLPGIALEHGATEDLWSASDIMEVGAPEHIFVIVSGGRRYPIVAVACRVMENDGDIFDSPF